MGIHVVFVYATKSTTLCIQLHGFSLFLFPQTHGYSSSFTESTAPKRSPTALQTQQPPHHHPPA